MNANAIHNKVMILDILSRITPEKIPYTCVLQEKVGNYVTPANVHKKVKDLFKNNVEN